MGVPGMFIDDQGTLTRFCGAASVPTKTLFTVFLENDMQNAIPPQSRTV